MNPNTATFSMDGKMYVAKPYPYFDDSVLPIAANEYISYKLLMLLKSKGIDISVAKVELLTKDENNLGLDICLIDHHGEHSRVAPSELVTHENLSWVYWFDKWIGRLDSNGDTNTLKATNGMIYPVDFAMAYHWACGVHIYVHKVDKFDIKFNQHIINNKDDKVGDVIKSLTDLEIFQVIMDENLSAFIPRLVLTSYYTGLLYRRDNLQ